MEKCITLVNVQYFVLMCVCVCVCVQVQAFLEPFALSREKLQEVSTRLKKAMLRGLGKHTHHKAAVKMLPTFVRATPDGTGEAGSDQHRKKNTRQEARGYIFLLSI